MLVYDRPQEVARWVAEKCGFEPPIVTAAIGYENGELKAGAFFDNLSDNNVFCHIAASVPLPYHFLVAVGAYVWVQLGLERMSFLVLDTNHRSLELVRSLGAVEEGRIVRGHKRGDILVMGLFANACEPWKRARR